MALADRTTQSVVHNGDKGRPFLKPGATTALNRQMVAAVVVVVTAETTLSAHEDALLMH